MSHMAHPIYQAIGSLIKQRRKALQYKQEQLAKELNISRGALANIETGRQSILVHQLYRFAKVLDVKPTDLMPLVGQPISLDDIEAKLPDGLKPQQRLQVARFFGEDGAQNITSTESNSHARKRN